MTTSIDNSYKLLELTGNQTISKTEYTSILDLSPGRGFLDCLVFKVNDTNMYLSINIDGVDVVSGFILKDLSSDYGLEDKQEYNLPLAPIDSKTFRYKPRAFQEFKTNLTIKLKHASKSNKKLDAGYITYQEG